MNSVAIMGRLTADPELRTTTTGTAVAYFTVAVDRRYSGKPGERQTDFLPCQAWKTTAEFISKYFGKGQLIALTGSLQSHQFTDVEGRKRTAYEIVADGVYFTGDKRDNHPPVSRSKNIDVSGPRVSSGKDEDFRVIDADEDLPF